MMMTKRDEKLQVPSSLNYRRQCQCFYAEVILATFFSNWSRWWAKINRIRNRVRVIATWRSIRVASDDVDTIIAQPTSTRKLVSCTRPTLLHHWWDFPEEIKRKSGNFARPQLDFVAEPGCSFNWASSYWIRPCHSSEEIASGRLDWLLLRLALNFCRFIIHQHIGGCLAYHHLSALLGHPARYDPNNRSQ